jgi:hypothetical protein
MVTVKIRILVAVNADGEWECLGYSGMTDGKQDLDLFGNIDPPVSFHWVEAEIPVPETTTLPGLVVPEDDAEVGFGGLSR